MASAVIFPLKRFMIVSVLETKGTNITVKCRRLYRVRFSQTHREVCAAVYLFVYMVVVGFVETWTGRDSP